MTSVDASHHPYGDRLSAVASEVETPVVVVDRPRLLNNIERIARIASGANLRLHPHVKTHKSLKIAALQRQCGSMGLTVSKSTEAAVFLQGGERCITVAYPLIQVSKIDRVIELALDHGSTLRLIADSALGVEAIASVARARSVRVAVFLKVDVGLHRCGVDPEAPTAIALARTISENENLRFAGILSHAGHAYRATGIDQVRSIAAKERAIMVEFAARLHSDGIEVPEVSVGSTPTVLANDGFEGVTEIRPGNYVFMDRTQVELGLVRADEVALWVVGTVVSANAQFAVIDAGSKVLSSDLGPHGSSAVSGHGVAWSTARPDDPPFRIAGLSEEHGFVEHAGRPLSIGSRVVIMPNHACTVVNLVDRFLAVDVDGASRWTVDARGRTL